MSIKDHLIKLTMWWQGAQKLRNDRPGGAAALPPPVSFATEHYTCEILFFYIFHKSTFQTLLQLIGFSIWKVNPSHKELNLEFWSNVILNNCMAVKKQTSCISYCNWSTGIVMKWNTSYDSSILSSSISTVYDFHAESTVFLRFYQVACSKLAGHLQPSQNKTSIKL